jgi:hypothetical protein
MGAEAQCIAHFNAATSEGKAQLETDFLLFRGEFRVKVPFKEIKEIAAADGTLSIQSGQGTLRLDLGPAAARWLQKIQNPPSLMDKLGIKPESAVSVLGIHDKSFLTALESRTGNARTNPRTDQDFTLLGLESKEDLNQVAAAAAKLAPAGALWLVWPKGQKHITEAQVMAAGKSAGLVDAKIASFSATHTAMKFVIPKAKRP